MQSESQEHVYSADSGSNTKKSTARAMRKGGYSRPRPIFITHASRRAKARTWRSEKLLEVSESLSWAKSMSKRRSGEEEEEEESRWMVRERKRVR